MFKLVRQETLTPSVSEKVAYNSSDFNRPITFVEMSGGAVKAVAAAAKKIYGFVEQYADAFAADNQTVAKKTVSVQSDYQNCEFEITHSAALAVTVVGTYFDLATVDTITFAGTPTEFIVTELLPDSAGALKVVRFRIADPQTLSA